MCLGLQHNNLIEIYNRLCTQVLCVGTWGARRRVISLVRASPVVTNRVRNSDNANRRSAFWLTKKKRKLQPPTCSLLWRILVSGWQKRERCVSLLPFALYYKLDQQHFLLWFDGRIQMNNQKSFGFPRQTASMRRETKMNCRCLVCIFYVLCLQKDILRGIDKKGISYENVTFGNVLHCLCLLFRGRCFRVPAKCQEEQLCNDE